MSRIAELQYPQDFAVEPDRREWWELKPTARKVAATLEGFDRGNVMAAAILLARPGAQGLALEWARMIERRFPDATQAQTEIERRAGPAAPVRGYSDKLPPLRDKPPKDMASAMADLLDRAPAGSRGL